MNVDFVRDLVITMKKYDLNKSHLIQISSDSVYGENEKVRKTPWSEDDQVNPMSIYALTKLKSEDEAAKHLGNTLILRTAFYGINPFSKKSLLSWILDNAVNSHEMDGWKNVYFSPVSTIQLVEVINALVKKTETGIFNVGSIDACNKFDFIDAVCENSGYSPKINRVKSNLSRDQKIRPEFSVLNSDKLSSVIHWNSTWRSGLDEYLKIRKPFHLG